MFIVIAFRICCKNRLSEKYVYYKNINKIQIEWGAKASDLFQQRKKCKEGHKNSEIWSINGG
jgi:hypothetical protein